MPFIQYRQQTYAYKHFMFLFSFFVDLEQDKHLHQTNKNENIFILVRSKQLLFYPDKNIIYSKLASFI